MMKRSLLLSLFLLLAILPGMARSDEEERKSGPLVVYGDDLMFAIKEPKGWIGDIEKAQHLQAAVVLYPEQETFEDKSAVIAVQVSRKIDENTREDLAHDMQAFRELYPDVEFLDLPVKHPSYKSFSKVFSIPNSRYEYVTFLNPGKKAPFLFSVVLNTGRRQAADEELEAYREVVQSLEYVPQDGVKPPTKAGTGSGKRKDPAKTSGK